MANLHSSGIKEDEVYSSGSSGKLRGMVYSINYLINYGRKNACLDWHFEQASFS